MVKKLDFAGRVAIVTGAGSGIGRECALALAKGGAKVLVNDRGTSAVGDVDTVPADTVVAEIKAAGGQAKANYDAVEYGKEIVRAALREYKRLDILVNCAEICIEAKLGKMTTKEWDVVLTASLFGTFSVTRYAWEHMQSHRYGRIVNTGCVKALYGEVGHAGHIAAKMGVLGLTKALASEGSAYGIHCNAVIPLYGEHLGRQMQLNAKKMKQRFSAEMVATVMLDLMQEHCELNGEVVETGGGVVDMIRWQRAKGASFQGRCRPEDIAEKWQDVGDFEVGSEPVARL